MRIDGNIAPEEQRDAFFDAAIFEDAHGLSDAVFIGGEEEHGHAVIALIGQQAAALLRFLAEETVWDLQQDAGTIARVALKANAAAVLQVHEHGKRIVHHLVGAYTFDVGERADAARIVLERAAIHARLWCGCLRQVHSSLLGGLLHTLFCARRFARMRVRACCFASHVVPLFACFKVLLPYGSSVSPILRDCFACVKSLSCSLLCSISGEGEATR